MKALREGSRGVAVSVGSNVSGGRACGQEGTSNDDYGWDVRSVAGWRSVQAPAQGSRGGLLSILIKGE